MAYTLYCEEYRNRIIMIVIKKQTTKKSAGNYKAILILPALCVLLVSFKKANNFYYTNLFTLNQSDTLASTIDYKFKTLKTVNNNPDGYVPIKHQKVKFVPRDPDANESLVIPLSETTETLRARIQARKYLDSLIIDPKSTGLVKNAKRVFDHKP